MASIPVDVARTIEEAMPILPLDVVHVHEPFAPSAASLALRQSRALNVATFHAPTERILSTQLGRPLSQLLFSRLDTRLTSYHATRDLMMRFWPADYEVLPPAAEPVARSRRADGEAVRIVMIADEERVALRTLLRALRELPREPSWRATVWSSRTLAAPATLSRALRERVTFLGAGDATAEKVLGDADVLVLGSEGIHATPAVLVQALASGIVPVASRLPVYEELLSDGGRGLAFEPGDAITFCCC